MWAQLLWRKNDKRIKNHFPVKSNFIFEGNLAEKLGFWASKFYLWRKSRRKASFLSFKVSMFKELSQKSVVFGLFYSSSAHVHHSPKRRPIRCHISHRLKSNQPSDSPPHHRAHRHSSSFYILTASTHPFYLIQRPCRPGWNRTLVESTLTSENWDLVHNRDKTPICTWDFRSPNHGLPPRPPYTHFARN